MSVSKSIIEDSERMRSALVDLIRLIIIVLLLPLVIVLLGPLLVLAVLRGHQRFGPLVLDSSRYDFPGKAGIFMLGTAIWLLVWGGLAWLAVVATSPPPEVVQAPAATLSADVPTSRPTFTATPLPSTPTPTNPVSPSPPAATATATPKATATATPTPTSTPQATSTLTATPNSNIVSTSSPTPTATQNSNTATPTRQAPLTPAERLAAVETVEQANLLLRRAISLPSDENLANLRAFWQDTAYAKVEDFAVQQYEKYAKPFDASFEFIRPPIISPESTANQLVVSSRERWRYGGTTSVDEEAFEFTYTLELKEGGWIITHYTYRNLPPPTPTTIVRTPTPTPVEN